MMNDTRQLALLDESRMTQYRMARLQVFNWGTFSGIHEIPVSEKGFLLVGPSGAGKSTLLDALSVLLVPPAKLDLNAAARATEKGGKDDRNLASYVRGAWSEERNEDSGEFIARHLRTGSTWSALALTYRNRRGKAVTLVQVFWMRGTSHSNADVHRHYLVFERDFDVSELGDFAYSNYNVRALKQAFPEAQASERFGQYSERFCQLLGIENETTLRLLHKTQSAKNLGDLNTFLREFMLEKPETYAAADQLVEEFSELNAAHQAVVTAREQVDVLAPARAAYLDWQDMGLVHSGLASLQNVTQQYVDERTAELLSTLIEALDVQKAGAEAAAKSAGEAVDTERSRLADLQTLFQGAGGGMITTWTEQLKLAELQLKDRQRKRNMAAEACTKLDWSLPAVAAAFTHIQQEAQQEAESFKQAQRDRQAQSNNLAIKLDELGKELGEVRREVSTLERKPSNIPAKEQEMRAAIARAVGLPDSALPFVGELVQVKADEGEWNGAIERALRGFAMSMLVSEQNYADVATYVNANNLGGRLVYHRTSKGEQGQMRPIGPKSLVLKVDVKSDTPHSEWLRAELRRGFDYACVNDMAEFRASEKAITREGQIKHSRTRHEKDDRTLIDDRKRWVLGFDSRAKLALYVARGQALGEELAKLSADKSGLDNAGDADQRRLRYCNTLLDLHWDEIDTEPLQARIDNLAEQIRQAEAGDSKLAQLKQQIEAQRDAVKGAEAAQSTAQAEVLTLQKQIGGLAARLDPLRNAPPFEWVTDEREQLDARFDIEAEKLALEISPDTIELVARKAGQALGAELASVANQMAELRSAIIQKFDQFRQKWPAEAADVDSTLASADEFMAKLERIEADGLPAYESRFFDLLQNQSGQNLTALLTYMSQARKEIGVKLEVVNESLQQVWFNAGTRLQIEIIDRQLEEVAKFRQGVQAALANTLGAETEEQAEARFLALKQLVEDLSSQEPEKRRRRDLVLDVRQHVEFLGRETSEDGTVNDTYRSGAGKSGGQRQKLTTFCLAAALRYQLGGSERGLPQYAAVVLDEAFDKADSNFTTLAMTVFENFGFQMIVATPMKSVMTLEPFIGGACFVSIADRHTSSVLLIEYDDSEQRLKLTAEEVAAAEAAEEAVVTA